jgi:peroxiredoxin
VEEEWSRALISCVYNIFCANQAREYNEEAITTWSCKFLTIGSQLPFPSSYLRDLHR